MAITWSFSSLLLELADVFYLTLNYVDLAWIWWREFWLRQWTVQEVFHQSLDPCRSSILIILLIKFPFPYQLSWISIMLIVISIKVISVMPTGKIWIIISSSSSQRRAYKDDYADHHSQPCYLWLEALFESPDLFLLFDYIGMMIDIFSWFHLFNFRVNLY